MSEDDEHLREIPTGAGCTEIWEKLSEQREAERDVDSDSDLDRDRNLGADAAVDDLPNADRPESDDDR